MRTAVGAVGGALAVGAMLVSYNLGARSTSAGQMSAPTAQMMIGPDGIARPYLVQASQGGVGQPLAGQPYAWAPYGTTTPGAVAPLAYAAYPGYGAPQPVQTQYVTERAVTQPVRRVSRQQRISSEVKPARSDRKSTRLNSSHANISYAVFCLKKKKKNT